MGNTAILAFFQIPASVHPHRRGEHWTRKPSRRVEFGSSPQAWGTPHHYICDAERERFIPTGVGNTCDYTTCRTARTVHPHRRGEHILISFGPTAEAGSSPQAWGTLPRWPQAAGTPRFIPTGVGNTRTPKVLNPIFSVHPHRRGEHPALALALRCPGGSSPQAWGTLFTIIFTKTFSRFIPTGVGNTM